MEATTRTPEASPPVGVRMSARDRTTILEAARHSFQPVSDWAVDAIDYVLRNGFPTITERPDERNLTDRVAVRLPDELEGRIESARGPATARSWIRMALVLRAHEILQGRVA
jgi:hypothetical protein